ncbi:hypothetical protein HNP32_003430 [Brevundimonas bullata]|uniref:Portal protein n=1 Tax=Brevundimonas bullata TaxID=13160 RepID=A0A7W7N4J3_9CAUL|nr:hypothetical protein [Brevundimonas bullata]MBB4799670.1 hypothetical protein [Brevundimonas bullata]MBB6384708.1 hypothetical protein [Brevundimonas bullata]
MEDSVKDDAHLARLIGWFEEAEEATHKARALAERDRDYYDNKQWTADERAALEARGQPVIAFNVIKSRVEYLLGIEKQQRRDPRAYYRNQPDQPAADAFTSGLRFAADTADFHAKRTKVWKNIVIEGYGGVELYAEQDDIDYALKMNVIPWDRIVYDPHCAQEDYSDARYIGQVRWTDLDEGIAKYGEEARSILETTLASFSKSETYDDKPKWTVWADSKRKRVRVVSMWYREADGWHWCDYTQAGELASGPSPYVDKQGQSYCPIILESAHVDRDNNRYGEVRHLVDPQDEVNKRRSKALHQSVSRGVIADHGAVDDVQKARKELARPDFYVEVMPGARFEVVDGIQMAAGQAALLNDAMSYIQQAGPNMAMMGKGTEDQSGRAIEAQQAGGMIEMGDLLDTLRRFDQRVFQMLANMMQQLWTAERWIRVTDDELAPQAVGLNAVQYDEYGQPFVDNPVAEMDVDVIVADAPHVIAMQGEMYQAFMQSLPQLAQMPPAFAKIAIKVNPALTSQQKREIIDALDEMAQPNPQAQQAQQAQAEAVQQRAAAEVEKIRSEAFKNMAQGEEVAARSQPAIPAYAIEPVVA